MKNKILYILLAIIIVFSAFMISCATDVDKEKLIVKAVQKELETESTVDLVYFDKESYVNCELYHYIAKVDGRYFVVTAKVKAFDTSNIEVDVVREI